VQGRDTADPVQRLFSEAPVQSKLLSFLAERSLAGTADELKEYSIGLSCFPNGNPIRLNRIRQSGYRPADSEAGWRSTTEPKASTRNRNSTAEGFFQPRFRTSAHRTRSQICFRAGGGRRARALESAKRVNWLRIAILTAFAVLVAAVAYEGFLVQQLKEEVQQSKLDPNVARLWQPLISSPRPLTLVVGMPLWMRLKGGYYATFRSALRRTSRTPQSSSTCFGPLGEARSPEYGFNGLGETVDASCWQVVSRRTQAGDDFSQQQPFVEDLRSQDVVLLGSSKANPHLRTC